MFGIGTSELIVIAFVVFLIYGPDKLPSMVRKAMKFMQDIRQASEDVTGVIRREVHNFEIMTKYPNENTPPHEPTESLPSAKPVEDDKKDPTES